MKINKLEYLGWLCFFAAFILSAVSFYYYDSSYDKSTKVPDKLNYIEHNQKGELVYFTEAQTILLKRLDISSIFLFFLSFICLLRSGNYKNLLKSDRSLLSRKSEEDL